MPTRGVFSWIRASEKTNDLLHFDLKVRATKLYDILSPIVEVMFALLDFTIGSPTRARIRASAVFRFLPSPLHLTLLKKLMNRELSVKENLSFPSPVKC